MKEYLKYAFKKLLIYILCVFVAGIILWVYQMYQAGDVSYENIELFNDTINILLIPMLLFYQVFMFIHFLFHKDKIQNKSSGCIQEVSKPTQSEIIAAIHEAGHYVVTEYFGYTIMYCNIFNDGSYGGITGYCYEHIPQVKDLKNSVIICYAGICAEIQCLGSGSNGIFGSPESRADIERANDYLRQYIILTDDLSFTGFEEEYIRNKSIQLSKQWKIETEDIVTNNLEKIKQISDELLDKKYICLEE